MVESHTIMDTDTPLTLPSPLGGERVVEDRVRGAPAGSLRHRPASFFERLSLSELFSTPRPLEVELGSGDGGFLAQYAAAHPETNFIGVERLLGRLRKIDKKGLRAGLTNLRLIRVEAGYLVEYLLPPGSVRALHIYFPDPWPKRRHHRRRLINPRFAEAARTALEPGGRIYFRTDHEDYFAQMLEVFGAIPEFHAVPIPPDLRQIQTDFERDFVARGIQLLVGAVQRRGGPSLQ